MNIEYFYNQELNRNIIHENFKCVMNLKKVALNLVSFYRYICEFRKE